MMLNQRKKDESEKHYQSKICNIKIAIDDNQVTAKNIFKKIIKKFCGNDYSRYICNRELSRMCILAAKAFAKDKTELTPPSFFGG